MKRRYLYIQSLYVIVFTLIFTVCKEPVPVPETIILDSFRFMPDSLTILSGITVLWSHQQTAIRHTVTSNDGFFSSDTLISGDTFEHIFEAPGEFPYHCIFHVNGGMVGNITVK